jgi:hypothetical protein
LQGCLAIWSFNMDLTRRSAMLGAMATPVVAASLTTGQTTYAWAEAVFMRTQWALLMRERLAQVLDHAENDTDDRVQVLARFGVRFAPTEVWKITGREALASMTAIRLARLSVDFGLASECEAHTAAAEPLRCWRALSRHPHDTA